jgi:HK97 family phage portal protein
MIRQLLTNAQTGLAGLAFRAATKLGYSAEHYAAIGGRSLSLSLSGKTVSQDTAYKVAAYKRGVQLISDYIGKTPYHVKAGNKKAKDHPAWPLVRRWAIWHEQSAFQFRRVLTVHALTRGNGYALIRRDPGTMQPMDLRILDPSRIQPARVSGRIVYRISNSLAVLESSDVIHIRGFGDDGICGLDPIITYARDVLGLAIAQQDYAATYYAAGGVPSVYGKADAGMSQDAWNRLESKEGALKNALDDPHRIPILEGIELKNTNLSAEQTQLLGAREFSLKDIANCLGMTVHKLNGTGNSSYKSLEEENRAFRDDTLDPFLCQFEIEYAKLLTEAEQVDESHDIEAVRESLTRTNMLDRANYLKTAIGGPWMTPAEGRDVDSLEEKPGADELLKPLNMTPPEQVPRQRSQIPAVPAPTEPAPASVDSVQVRHQITALTDVLERMTKRLSVAASRAAGKSPQFPEFLSEFRQRHETFIGDALAPIVALCSGSQPLSARTLADGMVGQFASELQQIYDTTPKERFAEAVTECCERLEESAANRAREAVLSWI